VTLQKLSEKLRFIAGVRVYNKNKNKSFAVVVVGFFLFYFVLSHCEHRMDTAVVFVTQAITEIPD